LNEILPSGQEMERGPSQLKHLMNALVHLIDRSAGRFTDHQPGSWQSTGQPEPVVIIAKERERRPAPLPNTRDPTLPRNISHKKKTDPTVVYHHNYF